MTERPIIFNGPMVRAILDGRKIQTRRPMKPQPVFECGYESPHEDEIGIFWKDEESLESIEHLISLCPHGKVGDTLWVRETWKSGLCDHAPCAGYREGMIYQCGKPIPEGTHRWKPSIHMPRWASRIILEITDVRVERLQSISEEDARLDGLESWESNPWVWAISFRRIES